MIDPGTEKGARADARLRDKPKLRHIAANPRVALAMRTDEYGDDIVVVTGDASVDPSAPPVHEVPEYVEK